MPFREQQFENPPMPSIEKLGERQKTELPQGVAAELRKKVLSENFEVPEPITEKREKELKKDIDNVANIFEKAQHPWFLGGGVALELHDGKLKRDHHDQDVYIYEEDRQAFTEAIRKSGYDFFFPLSGKKDGLATKEQITTERNFHLNKVDKHMAGPSQIDLWFLQKEKGSGDTIWDENVTISRNLLEGARKYISDNGKEVSLIPKEVLLYNKILGGRQLDFHDIKTSLPNLAEEERRRLDGYLENSGVSFVVAGQETRNIDELMQLAETETKAVKGKFLVPEIDKINLRNYNADIPKIFGVVEQISSQKEFLAKVRHELKIKAYDMPRWEIRTKGEEIKS